MLVFLEAVRLTARPAARTAHSLCFRHLSTATKTTFLPFPHQRTQPSILSLAPYSRRTLSLGSIFSRSPPQQTPSPLIVAHITRLEAEANVNPHDVSKQLALFQALADTKLKSSYDLIISRWERMCEFDNTSPLLHSAPAFQLYLTALVHTGQKSSINPAVRRRDSLLASSPVLPPSTQAQSSGPSIASSSHTAEALSRPSEASNAAATAELATEPPPLTSSQQIAEAVLQGQGEHPASQTGTSTPTMAKLQAAFDSGNSGGPIQVSIVERKGSWIPRMVRFVALTLVSSFFFLVILSVFFENTGFMKAGPKQNQFEPAEGKTVKFSDVHGVDEAKDELHDVVQFLKDPTSFATLGGKLPKGVLLTGPPGTGKTMLARAVAGEAGVPFFFASGSDFEEMFVGVGAKRVRELFAAARKKEPAIIFIDELDAVGGKRSSRDQQYMKQTLNQLLVEMDGFQQNEGVIVIAATNFPESLDQALVRPGRFDRIIAVPLPDVRGRVQILQHHMQGVTTSSDVDSKVLARGTPGFSGADLQNMVNQAAIQASKEGASEVTLKHFEWAKDRILMGAERKSHYIDHDAKLATAYHEGGHALVALYTDGAMPLHKVTCVPRGHALGYTSLLPEDDRTSISLKEYLAGIDVSMGGRVAEELIYGPENVTSGASSDIRSATRTARSMVKQWGFSRLGPVFYDDRDENLSPRRKEEIEEEVTRIVRGGEARATALLTEKLEELHRLARALVEHETLDSEEVKKVIKGEPIRNITEVLDEALGEELSHLESRREAKA
ncbi:putative peptidase family M41 [Lyophyllum shimeji]|uniref:Peptidase family M41 n=1 Tax=Lyophyllum shimeji TaxID=47721 RepID=A0A9P3PFB6_LYOSH|nr:putative peptidase family M41 [Lyophyllum shimeji]